MRIFAISIFNRCTETQHTIAQATILNSFKPAVRSISASDFEIFQHIKSFQNIIDISDKFYCSLLKLFKMKVRYAKTTSFCFFSSSFEGLIKKEVACNFHYRVTSRSLISWPIGCTLGNITLLIPRLDLKKIVSYLK